MAKAQPNRTKAETLSLRVAPDLKFGLEMLSKLEDRSLTTIIERALRDLFMNKSITMLDLGRPRLFSEEYPEANFGMLLAYAWSVDGPVRLFRSAILFPGSISVRDMALLDLIFSEPYFKGKDKVGFNAGSPDYDKLLSDLCLIFWEQSEGVDLGKIRRNWTNLNDIIDAALASGHYPESYAWD
ncbi:hypothetical protein [Pseudomonas sp. NY15354]|uniref:hypothetical protein n=1 Tax=Pseudomonas sp. NY15354 TaxID=3400351 RepID=UPI003A88619A